MNGLHHKLCCGGLALALNLSVPSVLAQPETQASVSVDPVFKGRKDIAQVAEAVLRYLQGSASRQEPEVTEVLIAQRQYALAKWRLGEVSGDAVLVRREGVWRVLSPGWHEWDILMLENLGVPRTAAQQLLAARQTQRS